MSLKKDIIRGTAILTVGGIVTRLLGLVNRAYLSRIISAEELGRYQLVFPVFMLGMAVCCSGIQVALSKIVSELCAKADNASIKRAVWGALRLVLLLSGICTAAIYFFSESICSYFLRTPSCTALLRIVAFALPFSAVHGCISGFYLGLKKTALPAFSQFAEQIVRVCAIYILSAQIMLLPQLDASLAAYGMLAGEMTSCGICMVCWMRDSKCLRGCVRTGIGVSESGSVKKMYSYAATLTTNRVAVTLLQSAEMVLLPVMLTRYYGGDNTEAMSVFGIVTGMAVPVLMFPSTLTNSLANMLLPAVSEAQADGNYGLIGRTVQKSILSCMVIGILSAGLFLFFGRDAGILLFNNEEAGRYLRVFAFACPMLYLHVLLSATLNGLGRVRETLLNHVIESGIKIFAVCILVPMTGVYGYMVGMCVAGMAVSRMAMKQIEESTGIHIFLFRPAVMLICSVYLSGWMASMLQMRIPLSGGFGNLLIRTGISCGIMSFIYILLIWITQYGKDGTG